MKIKRNKSYILIKINELTSFDVDSSIQIIGRIQEYNEKTSKVVIEDGSGRYTLFSDIKNITVGESVLRVFGVWNGIELKVKQVLLWNIPYDKIYSLFKIRS